MVVIATGVRDFINRIRERKNESINADLKDSEKQLEVAKENLSIEKNNGASRAKNNRDTQIHNLNVKYKVIDSIQQFFNKPNVTLEEDARMTPLIASNVTYINETYPIRSVVEKKSK